MSMARTSGDQVAEGQGIDANGGVGVDLDRLARQQEPGRGGGISQGLPELIERLAQATASALVAIARPEKLRQLGPRVGARFQGQIE